MKHGWEVNATGPWTGSVQYIGSIRHHGIAVFDGAAKSLFRGCAASPVATLCLKRVYLLRSSWCWPPSDRAAKAASGRSLRRLLDEAERLLDVSKNGTQFGAELGER
ncbi:MAG: hypothetical protein O3B84_00630, partial [Chloroflexi bacterium]|nr:hypothetical protein [Chloroflexota bacterium]